MLRSRALRIAVHVAGWLLLTGLIVGFVSATRQRDGVPEISAVKPQVFLFVLIWIGVFYLNKNVLVPRLYLRKKHLAYFGLFTLLLAAVYVCRPFENLVIKPGAMHARPPLYPPHPLPRRGVPPPFGMHPPGFKGRTDITGIIMFLMVWSLSFGLAITRQWRRTERRAAEAETEKAKAELNVLKAQINPHFLFNTLNNIYAMAVTGNEATAPSILKLAQIMRYLTETAQQDAVPLESAVACMSDFIDLHRVRLNKMATVDYTVTGNLQGLHIAPLLLLPFVENVFKYGISSHEPSPVVIRLEAEGKNLRFFCRNRIFAHNRIAESTGIGINNTSKRLALLYPDRHHLHISTEGEWFTVALELQL